MNRLIEILLGLDRGFLARDGEFSLSFNAAWPGQQFVGAAVWNAALIIGGLALVGWIYRRETRRTIPGFTLAALRAALVLLVIGLLNRPALSLEQSRTEPSVLAVLIDRSVSMRVADIGDADHPRQRLAAVKELFAQQGGLLAEFGKIHRVKLFDFSSSAEAIESAAPLEPTGQSTDVTAAVNQVLSDLQGQRVAAAVVLTDGRDSPLRNTSESMQRLASLGVKVFAVAVGSDRPPMNWSIQNVAVQDSAFLGDIVNVAASVRGAGVGASDSAVLRLIDKSTGQPLQSADGRPVEQMISVDSESPREIELQFRPSQVGTMDVGVEIVAKPGEIDLDDNTRTVQIAVLDSKINVLYVEGYPRWEYRYLKNEMIRDKSVDISCLLTSADPTFRQEGDRPITRFPESLEELLDYDVIVFGDVDPRQFSDFQLQLVNEFVSKAGGGFAMVAGPQFSPLMYRGTSIEPILPVNLDRVTETSPPTAITQGFRPVLTKVGASSAIFRFFASREQNEKFIAEQMQPLFWYCSGVTAKAGVGEVYAEHPTESGPDGRRAPLLTLGRFGAGRTLFSAIDDSWRWRYYTGESIFDTYWVQQLRYLARGRKLGQRQVSLSSARPVYDLGEQVTLNLRVLNPQLLPQLPDPLRVDILQAPENIVVAQRSLSRQDGQPDLYTASFAADRMGNYSARVSSVAGGVDELVVPFQVQVPRVELAQPQIDRPALNRLATQTGGKLVELADANALPGMIQSAARIIPIETTRPLWDSPLAMALFVLLITAEWIGRKVYGLV